MKLQNLRTPHVSKEGRIFSWAALIHCFGTSLLLPIFPNFIESIINSESYVGYFYSAMAIAMAIAGLTSSFFFRKFSRMVVLYFAFTAGALLTMFFVFVNGTYLLFSVEFLRVFVVLYILMALALMVRDFAKANNLGKTEGFYYLFSNIGWAIGPITGGLIARYAGNEPVFILSGLCMAVTLLYLSHQHLIKKHPSLAQPHLENKVKKADGFNRFKKYIENRNRIIVYFVSVALVLWMSFKTVVVPLFVADSGYGSDTAGLIISLCILPYVLFEMPIGQYADKKGFRIPIISGFFIIASFALAAWLSPVFYLNALFLILANVGAAFIEPLRDVYFFKNVEKENEDALYGVFITSDPVGRFLGPAIISTTLIFLPFNSVFVVMAIILAIAGVFSFLIKDRGLGR